MNLKYIIIYLLCISIIKNTYAQSLNQNYLYYGNRMMGGGQVCLYKNYPFCFYTVVDTSDTSILATASVCCKLNSNGSLLFNPLIRPDTLAWFNAPNYNCKSHTLSDGFISSGFGLDYSSRDKILLVVYDTNGLVKLSKAYNHNAGGSFDAIRTRKNQYILAGRVIESSEGLPMYILTDSMGNELSYKFYNGADLRYYDDVFARSIIELDSGNALLVCDAFKDIISPPSDRWKVPVKTILIKVDSVGNELWRWIDPSNDGRAAFSFQKTRDGGYISCGLNIGDRDSINWDYSYQPCIIKWRNDLSIEWKKWYDDFRKDSIGGELFDIKELSDGSFIACGNGGETKTELIRGGIILKVDSNGNLIWRKYYSAFPDSSANRNIENYLYDIDVFESGDIIAVGETRPTWGIGQRAWILRTDSNGCIVDSNWCGWNSIEVEPTTPKAWQAQNELFIYPNPANDVINITFNPFENLKIDNYRIEIYDAIGKTHSLQVIQKETTLFEELKFQVNIKNLISGMYFIRILDKDNKAISNGKFVKE